MAGALIGALRVTLGIDTAAFNDGLGIAQKRLAEAGKKMQAIGDGMADIGARMSVGITAPLIAAFAGAVKGAQAQAHAMGQVNAALDSMGGAAGRTSEELLRMADAMEMRSLFDGDVILKELTANMLTFGNVAGQQFDRAQQAALDLATRMDGDLQAAALTVGKALNDPIKGMASLGRVGIQLSESQKAAIQSMVAMGDTAGAQGIILGELEKQFGGAAEAAADASPWRTAQVAIGQAGDAIGTILLPVVEKIAAWITNAATAFAKLSPEMQGVAVGAAAFVAAVGPVLVVAGTLVSSIGAILPAFSGIATLFGGMGAAGATAAAGTAAAGTAASTAGVAATGLGAALAPLLPIIAAVGAAGVLIYSQWDKIKPVLQKVGASFQEAVGPKVTALIESVKGALTQLQPVFNVLGDIVVAFAEVMGPKLTAVFASAVDIITGFVGVVGNLVGGVVKLLSGDFAGAWESAKAAVGTMVKTALSVLANFAPGVARALSNIAATVYQIGKDIIAGLVRGIMAAPGAVWNALKSVISFGVDQAKSFLGIRSPSRLFMEIGKFTVEGMAIGIQKNKPKVLRELMAMTAEMQAVTEAGMGGMFDATEALMDRLIPNRARSRQYAADKSTIETSQFLTAAEKADLKGKLFNEFVRDSFGPAMVAAYRDMGKGLGSTQALFDTFKKHMANDVGRPVVSVVEGMANAVGQAAQSIGNALRGIGDAFKNGGFWDKLGAIADLISVGAQAYGQISGAFNTGSGGTAGALAKLKAGFGGARAGGGPVLANQAYLVGEKRPEMFVPSSAGRIVPKVDGSTGGGNVRVEIVDTTNLFETRVTQTAASVTASGIGALENKRRFAMSRVAP